jgi:hypothetical protein
MQTPICNYYILREEYCWLVAGGWFVLREKYCWLVADKPNEQAPQPASSILLSEQTSTSHQPPANRTSWTVLDGWMPATSQWSWLTFFWLLAPSSID